MTLVGTVMVWSGFVGLLSGALGYAAGRRDMKAQIIRNVQARVRSEQQRQRQEAGSTTIHNWRSFDPVRSVRFDEGQDA